MKENCLVAIGEIFLYLFEYRNKVPQMIKIIEASGLNLADHIRTGDTVTWGQATAEPLELVGKYIEQRADIGKTRAWVGITFSGLLKPEHTDFISPLSYGSLGSNSALSKAGVLDYLPSLYSQVPVSIESGRLKIDVVFVQISPPGPDGSHSLGFCNDYLPAAIKKARLVIAEINENVPWTYQDEPLDPSLIDFAITTDYQPVNPPIPAPGEVDQKIAGHIASVVQDGATIQYGIGSIPIAVIKSLAGHKNLGLHSGLITDDVIDLIETGTINNSQIPIHPGISVGAVCIGGERLKNFLHDNKQFELHQIKSTHGNQTLAQIDNFVGINSALEVDLYGQINAEQIGKRYIGAIGGQVDYMHAGTNAVNGLSIIALPASDKSGTSRIVSKLNGPLMTTVRSEVDLVITEHGIADLRGKTLQERANSLTAIAPPESREDLARDFPA